MDEAIALPTDFSARIARNTQIYIQGGDQRLPRRSTPWAGSYYETLTNEIAHKAWERIEEVESWAVWPKAIETGIPKSHREASARKQARIDSGERRSSASTNTVWRRRRPFDRHSRRGQHGLCARARSSDSRELRANFDEAAVKKALAPSPRVREEQEAGQPRSNWPSRPPRSAPRWAKSPMPAKWSQAVLQKHYPFHFRCILTSRVKKRQILQRAKGCAPECAKEAVGRA